MSSPSFFIEDYKVDLKEKATFLMINQLMQGNISEGQLPQLAKYLDQIIENSQTLQEIYDKRLDLLRYPGFVDIVKKIEEDYRELGS